MPYIKKSKRQWICSGELPTNSGELNYLISLICLDYLKTKGESYQTYNDIIGALECAKLEMYSRKITPYEKKKIKENGDIF